MVVRKKKTRSSEEDRISHLPNALICDILSHLSTKETVKTSILSTKWRSLWRLVPTLDLQSSNFRIHNGFMSFTNRFFDFHRDSCIHKLKLVVSDSYVAKFVLTPWIDAVSTRRIQHLDIRIYSYDGSPVIPLSLYTCKTLVHLRLYKATLVNAEFVSLPCLKIIYLEGVEYPNDSTLEKLISGSPVLEDFTLIHHSTYNNATVLQVRSQTLKRIHINEFTKFVIDAPLLQCLKAKVYNTKNFKIINSDFSAKVDIDVQFGGALSNHLSNSTVIRDVLTDISRVKDLVINCFTWKVIFQYTQSGPLPQFCYLSRLYAKFTNSNTEMLPTLLESCPKLESLILELDEDPLYIHSRKKRKPKLTFSTVPLCLVSSLKYVELKRPIMGYEGEMNLVKYFLKNSKILEKLTLRRFKYNRVKAKYVMLQELLAMPRSSSSCEIVFLFIS